MTSRGKRGSETHHGVNIAVAAQRGKNKMRHKEAESLSSCRDIRESIEVKLACHYTRITRQWKVNHLEYQKPRLRSRSRQYQL